MPVNRNGSRMKSIAALGATAFAVVALATVANSQAPADPEPDPALLAALMDEGATVYRSNCHGCHGADGEGQPPAQDAAPALAGNSSLRSVGVIVFQVINGGDYMPPFGGLSNQQIAAVATYIRNSFGNDFGIATEEDVAN